MKNLSKNESIRPAWILAAVIGVICFGCLAASVCFVILRSSFGSLQSGVPIGINTADPNQAEALINRYANKIASDIKNRDFNSLMSNLTTLGLYNLSKGEFELNVVITSGSGDYPITVKGMYQEGNVILDLKMGATVTATPDLDLKMMFTKSVGFVRFNSLNYFYGRNSTITTNQWYKFEINSSGEQIPLEEVLFNFINSTGISEQDLKNLEDNGLVSNVTQAPNRVLDGNSLSCLNMDPATESNQTTRIEFCSKNGVLPIYLAMETEDLSRSYKTRASFELKELEPGQTVTVAEPADAKDISDLVKGLLGSF